MSEPEREGPRGGEDELEAQLARVAAFEATVRPTLMSRIFSRIGPTRPFVAVYRRLGPRIDPWLQRRTGGGINRLYGFPGMTLHTTGARSGAPRQSPLFYVRDGEDFVVVGTNFGTEHHPAWTANLRAHPDAEVEVADVRLPVQALPVDDEDFRRLWPGFRAMYPGYDRYLERLSERTPRMFRLRPVRPG